MANTPDEPSLPLPDDRSKGPQEPANTSGAEPSPELDNSALIIDLGLPDDSQIRKAAHFESAQLGEAPPSESVPPPLFPEPGVASEGAGDDEAIRFEADTGPDSSFVDLGAVPPQSGGPDSSVIVAEVVDSSTFLPASSPPTLPTPSSSAIDLGSDPGEDFGAAELQEPVYVEQKAPPTDEAVDLDAFLLEDEVGGPEGQPSSGIDLPEATHLAANVSFDPSEVVDLSDADIVVEEAVVDLPPAGSSGVSLGVQSSTPSSADSAVDLDDFLLQEPAKTDAAEGSSRDLIAENLESGVDLLDDHTSIQDDFQQALKNDAESSSVDLGSIPSIDLMQESETGPSEVASKVDPLDRAATELHQVPDELELEIFASSEHQAALPGKTATDEEEVDLDALLDAAQQDVGPSGSSVTRPSAVDDEEEVEKPAPRPTKGEKSPVRAGSSTGAWIGGTLIGTVIGTAACVGAWFGGLVPPAETPSPTGRPPAAAIAPPTPQITFAATLERIRNGDLDAVTAEALERADESKADELVARAEFNWLNYLRTERGKNPQAVLRVDAEPVQRALGDLEKAIGQNNADALFLRGQIHEMTGNLPAARADYQAGLKQFADNLVEKTRFETALQVLDLTDKVSLILPRREAMLFALLLVTLQEPIPALPQPLAEGPPANQPTNPSLPPEAGHSFWRAIAAARKNDFSAALQSLGQARKNHDLRRYLLPRKPLNPSSDPREAIFLRCCDELQNYWLLLQRLNSPNYLALDPKARIPQVDALLNKIADAAQQEQIKTLAARLVKDKSPATAEDLVKLIEAERKTAAARLTEMDQALTAQKKVAEELSEKLKETSTRLTQTQDLLSKSQQTEKLTQQQLQASLTTLKGLGSELGLKFTDAKADGEKLLAGVREANRLAKLSDPTGTIRKLEANLRKSASSLNQRWTTAQMLDFWLPLLHREPQRADLAARAGEDAQRILDEESASAQLKAKAQLLQGLILRNQDRFSEALPVLQKAREGLVDAGGDWLARAEQAIREASSPGETLARQAQSLQQAGKPKEARAVLDRLLKTTENKGPLLLQRARLALEAARAKGRLQASDPQVTAALADAVAAGQQGEAKGHLLAGQIAEEVGQLAEAASSYRAAMQAAPANDETGIRARIALARVLLKQQSTTSSTTPRSEPGTRSTSRLPATRPGEESFLQMLNVLLAVTLQPGLPADPAASSEAEKLADEILALGDKAPFDARAQALAIKGLHSRALTVYVTGLRDKKLLAPELANQLLQLVEDHPILRRPESLTPPNPLRAEKLYASGVYSFFACKYRLAEDQLLAAIENDSGDARYYYFLGLARLVQGKREGYEDFDIGARLEAQGRPDRGAVTAALERVQGPLRKELNAARTRP